MIKAIFFDQDNTLLQSQEAAKVAYKSIFEYISKSNAIQFDLIYEYWKSVVEKVKLSTNPNERKFEFSLSQVIKKFELSAVNIQKTIQQMEIIYLKNLVLTDGTEEFLKKEKNLKKIVFTESLREITLSKLKTLKIISYFDMIITSSDTSVMKPHIKYINLGLEKFDLNAKDCIFVGDNWEKDCKIGQQLGGIGVVFGKVDSNADYSIQSMLELFEIIKIN